VDEDQALDKQSQPSMRYAWLLGLIALIGLGLDRLWISLDQAVPDAAQSQQLNQLLDFGQGDRAIANPLFYAVVSVVQQFLGTSPDQLLWTQAIFGGLLLIGVYGLGQRLFSRWSTTDRRSSVGLWSAGFCMLLPALLALRLRFSLDLALVAMVTVSLWRLVVWQQSGKSHWTLLPRSSSPKDAAPMEPDVLPWEHELQLLRQTIVSRAEVAMQGRSAKFMAQWMTWRDRLKLPPIPLPLQSWLNAIVLGVVCGLTGLTHPLALIYLIVPVVWAGLMQLVAGRWWRWCQWVLAVLIGWTIAWPWYRRNLPELVLAAVRSPRSLMPDLWHWDGGWLGFGVLRLADQLFYPLLLVGLLGLLLYRQRVVSQVAAGRQSTTSAAGRLWRRQIARSWGRSVGSLGVWIVVPLVLAAGLLSLNYLVLLPVIPFAIILLTQGLLLFPRSFFQIRWMVWGLMLVWSLANLFPIVPLRSSPQFAQPRQNWYQTALLQTVMQANPGLHQTIGVLAQTPQLNADYLTYLSRSLKLPIVATSIGLEELSGAPDRQMLPWYLLKTGDQGTVTALTQNPALQLAQTWPLPDGNQLQLWQRRQPTVQLTAIVGAQWSEDLPIKLEKVKLPAQATAGQPIPVAYTWAGRPPDLQAGLVEITWRRVSVPNPAKAPTQWFHDHAIGFGQLQAIESPAELVQVLEQTAMMVPAGAAGRYLLEATYLNPAKGERYPLVPPDVGIEIVAPGKLAPPTKPIVVPALDLITQGHRLAQALMQSADVALLAQLAPFDRADPRHQMLAQWRSLARDRLEMAPDQIALYPDLALAQFLQGDMSGTIATLNRLLELQPRNPQLPLYLAIAEATAGNPAAARSALDRLPANTAVPAPLLTLIAALKGNPIAQWQLYRLRLDLMPPTYRRMN
jgi:4-amino-4-deoxy-L-arabinose transferase-like glycosyltransferase